MAVILLGMLAAPLLLFPAKRPNIVLLFSDDQGVNDVGCYGSEIPTPNIDRLAKEGLKFTNFYSASSICTPSRFGLLTGRNPSTSRDQLLHALMFMNDPDRGIKPGEPTFANELRDAGYHTALVGKWHLGHAKESFLPVYHGFDTFIGHTGGCIDYFTMTYGNVPDWYHQTKHVDENGYATELITDEAVSFLERNKPGNQEKPFFLYLPFNAPHFGKGWDPKNQKPINIMQTQAADLKRVSFIKDKVRREFAAMTVNLDDCIGRILDKLKETELEKDTLVIFLTDHGGDPVYGGSNLPLRGNKATLFEGGTKVPCIFRWPGRIPAGTSTDALAWSLDLAPTLCNLARTRPPVGAEGRALDSLMVNPCGEAWDNAREIFWQTGSHSELGRSGWKALRQGTWKYLQTPDGEFLFDLKNDPNETTNLKHQEVARFERLRARAEEKTEGYKPSPPAGKLVIAGDSITAAEGVPADHGFPSILGRIGGDSLQVVQQGRSGWATTTYLRKMEETLSKIPENSDWILLQLGANDLRVHGHSDDTVTATARNIVKILRQFQRKAPKARLVLVSPPTMVPSELDARLRKAGFNDQSSPWLAKLGEAYANAAKENGWGYIDLHDTLATGHTLDGAHPNDRGHRRIAITLWQQLNQLNKSLPRL